MNKSFKVVFSKARGALMVVNELTSSVQAKGTKTVIAVAVASLVAGGAMAADTAKPGALLSWNGTELVGQAEGEGLVYSTKDGVLTITATGQKTGAEGVPGYGVVTNLYHADATGGTDILAKTGVSITGSNFKNNASTNAGGAVTLWQDGGAEAQPLAHRISASTFEGNSANFGGAVALMNQIAFAKNDGTTLSEGNVYKSNTGASGGAIYVEGSVLTSKGDVFTKNKATGKGGAVYVNNKGALFVENGRFEENSAVRGGAITNDNGSPLIVHNSVFSKNIASEYGGALFHGNGQFEVYDSEFTNNTSTRSGGAVASVFDVANTLKFVRSTFTGNKGFLGGAMAIYYGLEVTDSTFIGNSTTGIDDGGGAINLGGHAKVSITGTTFDGNTANLGGAISTRPAYYLDFGDDSTPKGDGHWLQISNSTFTNNVATVKDELNNTIPWGDYGMFNGFGGAIATGFCGSTLNNVYHGNYIEDSTFTGNKASYGGGALYNQGNLTVRGTTTFAGNTAQYGGAVYTDANSLTFDATSASDVISFTNNTATVATGGSDLFLGKHIRVDTDKANYKAAEVNLTGLGTISFGGSIAGLEGTSINSSAAKVSIADAAAFAGDFTITDGLTQISGAKFFGGKVSVEGGTLAVDGAWTASGSTTLKGGMITTAGANVFKKGDDGKYGTTLTDGWTALNKTNGKVELTDTGYDYTIEQLRAAQDALNGGSGNAVQLVLHGTLKVEQPLTDKTVDGLVAADQTVSANASGNFVVSNATTVGSIDFKEAENAESVSITTGTAPLTIEGNGGDVFANLSDTVKTVDASNSSVALGQSEESKGSVNVETLKVKNLEVVGTFDAVNAEVESLDVSGNFTAAELKVAEGDVTGTLSADKLTGTADKVINVGDDVDAGTVHLDTLALNGGTIFLDPSWTGDDTIDKGSFLAVTNLKDSVLTGRIVVGQNSTLALGGTKAETVDAFNRLGKSWGEDGVAAALYVGKTLSADVLKDAGILVDGSLEDRTAAGDLTSLSGIKMNAGSMLIVNQAGVGSGTAIDGKLAMSAASTLGIVNATEGTFKLASDLTVNAVDQDTTVEVVTDNPFISGSFGTGDKSNTVTTTFDSESGLGAIASTGVQAMARRADFVMTETVANRTSLDQPMHAGVNLWADVSGERYEADKLDNNGSFRADAAYATFGGDVEVLEGLTAGLALHYGDASLRSDVSGIKNDIASYGLTAYAGKSFGAAKVVGELAWLKSENDITAHQTALNQKLDANIYSAGVRAQYELAAGSFKFVPSIGLRVSRLETDDMTVGSIKVDEGDLTYVQMPISLRISGFEADAAGWTLAPSFKVAYVPTFGDKEVKVLGYSQDVLDMSPVQADFGLRAVNGNFMFNVDMMLGGGEAGTSSIGGKVGVKYAF